MYITSVHTEADWARVRTGVETGDEAAWREGVAIFAQRIEERFLRCIDHLLKLDASIDGADAAVNRQVVVPGFSIMAFCCLLADTLYAFYTGYVQTPSKPSNERCNFPEERCVKSASTGRAFSDFLKDSPHFKDFNTSAVRNSFTFNVRNGLLHDAETRSGWKIRRNAPREKIVEKRGSDYILNRTNFVRALRNEFADYLARLHDPQQKTLREYFLKKMAAICRYGPCIEPNNGVADPDVG